MLHNSERKTMVCSLDFSGKHSLFSGRIWSMEMLCYSFWGVFLSFVDSQDLSAFFISLFLIMDMN